MDHRLEVIAGPDQGRSFSLQDGQTATLGRGGTSDLVINDPRISRAHCTLAVDGGQLRIRDLGSTGGTFVDSSRVTEQALAPGAVIQLGDSQVRYRLDAAREATTLGGSTPPTPAVGAVAPLHQLVGHSLGNFRLDKIISAGNSGMVFLATDTTANQRVAVKVLTPDLAHSDEQKERFVRAMKTMLPIKHPNLVRLLGAGKNGPYCWAAMELIEGENLMQVIDRIGIEGMLDWRDVWRAAMHIGQALHEAATHKIIHRNVTPTNILRRKSDKVCLLGDLMLAKALEGTLAKQVTRPGQLIGELPFLSPERTRDGAEVDGRADLYGLGATLYALLTGRPPFVGDSLPDLIRQVRSEEPPRPKEFQLAINDKFQDVVVLLLAKRPEDRFATAGDLLKELERIGRFNNLQA